MVKGGRVETDLDRPDTDVPLDLTSGQEGLEGNGKVYIFTVRVE